MLTANSLSAPRRPVLSRTANARVVRVFASPADRAEAKAKLLSLIEGTDRGARADEAKQKEIEAAIARCERLNPNPKALSSPLVSGKWRLVYTTSSSILGTNRPAILRPQGPIFQLIDADNLRAKNWEAGWPFSQVFAELTPESSSQVRVDFVQFRIFSLIPISARRGDNPARGFLDVTYVDEEIRISRGDKGNLFVLLQEDNKARLQRIGW